MRGFWLVYMLDGLEKKKEVEIVEINSRTVNVCTIQTSDDLTNIFEDDDIDFDNFNLTEVIKFLQKVA